MMTNLLPDFSRLRTPCYVIHLGLLRKNIDILSDVQHKTGCRILLALKGFAAWSTFDQIRPHLYGIAASSLHEAMLGRQEFEKEVHLCAPAFRPDEMDEFLSIVDHIVFNSFSQWHAYKEKVLNHPRHISCGIRINPRHSEVAVPIYDPCASGSRLGTTVDTFSDQDLSGLEGLHFHTLCELNSDSLERTLQAVESQFADYIGQMKWVNFGGGHHITRKDYDVDRLCRLITHFQDKYQVQVYLEPGEAIALNTGFLISSVLDLTYNDIDIAILDTSAAAHMPDVLEMPYRPQIEGAFEPKQLPFTYRLAGMTCLAGDVIGDYSFDQPLQTGSRLIFHDMSHYTMVKNNTFNGIQLPDIVLYEPQTDNFTVVRSFDYQDYRNRLS